MNKKTYESNRKLAAQKSLSLTNLNLWCAKQGYSMHHQIKNNVRETFSRIPNEVNHCIIYGVYGMRHNVEGILIIHDNVDMSEYEYACNDYNK